MVDKIQFLSWTVFASIIGNLWMLIFVRIRITTIGFHCLQIEQHLPSRWRHGKKCIEGDHQIFHYLFCTQTMAWNKNHLFFNFCIKNLLPCVPQCLFQILLKELHFRYYSYIPHVSISFWVEFSTTTQLITWS